MHNYWRIEGDAQMLLKTSAILHFSSMTKGLGTEDKAIFEYARDGDEILRQTHLTLDPKVWQEMGYPKVVTITIEPGDMLN